MNRRIVSAIVLALLAGGFWYQTSSLGRRLRALNSFQQPHAIPTLASAEPPARPPNLPARNATTQAALRSQTKPSVAKAEWNTNFLSSIGAVFDGKAIQFDLPGAGLAVGIIQRHRFSGTELSYVSGQLTAPATGRFFFQKQFLPGIAGPFVGVVELPNSRKAYRIEPASNGGSEIVERPIEQVVCLELPQPDPRRIRNIAEIPPLSPAEFPSVPIPVYQNGIVVLESLAGAKPVVYLDFQGGYTETWGGISYERSTFGNSDIFEIWRRVAEDYMPFNINVTTDLKVFERAPENSRQRVIVTPTDTAKPGAGGASYVGTFNWAGDIPCWVFVTQAPKYAAEACAHEAGHCLGLIHDGQIMNGTNVEYFYGQGGAGVTGWAPIMGVAYYDNVTQWSQGEYLYANNPEDQLRLIASQNNVNFRLDDTGDTLATSRYLEIYSDYTAAAEGVIETSGDTDAFQFTTSGGAVSLRANPASLGPNLALQVSLYDASDTLLASNNPQQTLWAAISTNVAAGTYTFRVSGAGRNDPLTNGFSAYASLGYYSITGQVANARLPDRFAIPEYAPVGTVVGIVPPQVSNMDPLSYVIVSGNISNTFAIDSSGTLTVANNSMLDYEALARDSQLGVEFQLLVNITNTRQPAMTEIDRRIVVAVTNINEPPVITGFVSSNALPSFFFMGSGVPGWVNWPGGGALTSGVGFLESSFGPVPQFSSTVLDHSPSGTPIGTLLASDPDFYTLLSYSIIGGNSNQMFVIDDQTGTIIVAGDPTAAIQNLYDLTVVVSDQTPPVPLTATSTVTIQVELPYSRGSIASVLYSNVTSGSISNLAGNPSFPRDPVSEDHLQAMQEAVAGQAGSDTVIRGYLIPSSSGTYTFSLVSTADGELWLSSSTNPATMQRIASIEANTNQSWPSLWTNFNQPSPDFWTNYPRQESAPVTLSVGYAYYIEARFQEVSPSDYFGVAWECATNGISPEIIPGQYLAPYEMNYTPHPIGFTANLPRNAIAGAQVGRVAVSDINEQDSEALAIASTDLPGTFALDPLTETVWLADPTALSDTNITHCSLTIQATDNGTPPLSGTTTVTINFAPANTLLGSSVAAEIWTNIPGSAISNLTGQVNFPQRPDIVQSLDSLGVSSGQAALLFVSSNNSGLGGSTGFSNGSSLHTSVPDQINPMIATLYGTRIRGLLVPTNTGPFTFYISSADDSVFLLSNSTNPANAQVIASLSGGHSDLLEWSKFPSQQSVPQSLEAGSPCYFEVLSKTGPSPFGSFPGGILFAYGHVEVGWTGPGLADTNVIDGAFLQPIDIDYPPVLVNRTVPLPITSANGSVLATLAAQGSAANTFAYRILSGNVSNTFALDPYTGQLSIADNSSFANYAISNFSLVVEAQDSGYGYRYPLKSTVATITLPVFDDSPAFVWMGEGNSGNWSLVSNWNGTLPNEHSKLLFLGSKQQTNHNDILAGAGLVTLATGGFYIDGDPLLLRGGILSRGTNTWAVDSTLSGPQLFNAASGALTIQGRVHTAGNELTLRVDSDMLINGEISGTGGLRKLGGGPLVIGGTNTYSGRTDIAAGTVIVTNGGSLAATPTLSFVAGTTLRVDGCSTQYSIGEGQTLTGNGTVIGPITINGNLAPTWPSSGVPNSQSMLFSNTLVLAGNVSLTISKSAPSQTINVVGELDYGGVLTVTTNRNETWTIGTIGMSFRLFTATRMTGSFARLDLPPGFRWDTSQLSTNGVIRLIGTAPYVVPILPLVYTNSQVIVRFQTSESSRYTLESTASLAPPIRWAQSVFRTGTGGIISIPFAAPESAPQRFFRIKAD